MVIFHPISVKFCLYVLLRLFGIDFEGKYVFSTKILFFKLVVNLLPINSKNEKYTSYYKIWDI